MTAVYKKELRGYFNNMTGYVIIALMLVICGIFSTFYNFKTQYPDFEYVLYSVTFIFLILVPILTMRSFAEERHSKTDQLLYSMPMKVSSIVMGKYLAMLTVYAIPMAVLCVYPPILSIYGSVNFASSYSCIFAYFLLGTALIAIGMFMSTLTESQAIAAVLTFGALLLVYLMSDISTMIPSTALASLIAFAVVILAFALLLYYMTRNWLISLIAGGVLEAGTVVFYFVKQSAFESAFPSVLTKLSIFSRFQMFVNGVFDLGAIVYYLTVIFVFVFFSMQSLEKRRWS